MAIDYEELEVRFASDCDLVKSLIPGCRIEYLGKSWDPFHLKISVEFLKGESGPTGIYSRYFSIQKLVYVAAEVNDNLPKVKRMIETFCHLFVRNAKRELEYTFKEGQHVKLLTPIIDYGDGWYPPQVYGRTGDIVIVKKVESKTSYHVHHSRVKDSSFIVNRSEIESIL